MNIKHDNSLKSVEGLRLSSAHKVGDALILTPLHLYFSPFLTNILPKGKNCMCEIMRLFLVVYLNHALT